MVVCQGVCSGLGMDAVFQVLCSKVSPGSPGCISTALEKLLVLIIAQEVSKVGGMYAKNRILFRVGCMLSWNSYPWNISGSLGSL